MKLLAINGSPQADGTIGTALKKVVSLAEELGHRTEFVELYETNLAFCRGCYACQEKGACVYRDGIADLEKKILESDILVLATPTHWANMSSLMLNFFERLFGFFIKERRQGPPLKRLKKGKKAFIITSCSTPFPFNVFFNQSSSTIKRVKEVCRYSGIKVLNTHSITDAYNKGMERDLKKISKKLKYILRREK